jgi:hypothetical protein
MDRLLDGSDNSPDTIAAARWLVENHGLDAPRLARQRAQQFRAQGLEPAARHQEAIAGHCEGFLQESGQGGPGRD